ncbi:hypothetical protein C5167_002233 [Papaver somniferum]|uniref:Splicing factor 1 helix-hairpin domain-containing protein n=1 Tax=Papaver somniferum TaxID=3469 RepID=A0A4Y7KZ56_PAPSO|nr:hypothetical protein C5167_002233 [Papaver somniferum]
MDSETLISSSATSNQLDHHHPALETLATESIPNPETENREEDQQLVSQNGGGNSSNSEKDGSGGGGEEETNSRRKRGSRWDPPTESENADSGTRKKKYRWADDDAKPVIQLPDFMKEFTGTMDLDPEVQALNIRLLEISRILLSGLPLDDRPEGARSPEPIYDNMGVRINTREYRNRERLTKERSDIISQLIKRNPAFKPPADYHPPKL